jgi:uncharacterized DUF497 family protein
MNVVYQLQGVEFEWDGNKAQSNFEKHGVTFEEAAEVFFDPFIKQVMLQPTTNSVTLSLDIHFLSDFY